MITISAAKLWQILFIFGMASIGVYVFISWIRSKQLLSRAWCWLSANKHDRDAHLERILVTVYFNLGLNILGIALLVVHLLRR